MASTYSSIVQSNSAPILDPAAAEENTPYLTRSAFDTTIGLIAGYRELAGCLRFPCRAAPLTRSAQISLSRLESRLELAGEPLKLPLQPLT